MSKCKPAADDESFPWELDLAIKLGIDLEHLDLHELRREVQQLRQFAIDLCSVVRSIVGRQAR
jgi:hypothetical protein